jgi:shikimate kinase
MVASSDRDRAIAQHVVIVGLMGTGKSTTGTRLGYALGREFLDNDVLLEARTGATAARLQRDRGQEELHRLEAEVLLDALAGRPLAVIAAAASVVERDDVRQALSAACVVWLRATVGELTERLDDPGSRPIGDDRRLTLQRQADERSALYAAVADIVVDTTGKDPDTVMAEVIAQLR